MLYHARYSPPHHALALPCHPRTKANAPWPSSGPCIRSHGPVLAIGSLPTRRSLSDLTRTASSDRKTLSYTSELACHPFWHSPARDLPQGAARALRIALRITRGHVSDNNDNQSISQARRHAGKALVCKQALHVPCGSRPLACIQASGLMSTAYSAFPRGSQSDAPGTMRVDRTPLFFSSFFLFPWVNMISCARAKAEGMCRLSAARWQARPESASLAAI